MTKTTFVAGAVLNSAFLNALNNPVFTDPADNDGEIPLITNDNLSSASGQIKPEWIAFRDQLKVTHNYPTVSWTGGSVISTGNELITIPSGSGTLTNNASNLVYVNEAGSVVVSTIEPGFGIPLAGILVSSGAVQIAVDLRQRFQLGPRPRIISYFGGSGSNGAKVCTNGETLRGIYYFTTFSVPVGVSITIDKFAKIYCTGAASIAGTITVSPASRGGNGYATSVSGGSIGGITGSGLGAGAGTGTSGPYHFSASSLSSGGGSGFVAMSAGQTSTIASGGDGGGSFLLEAIGTISVSGTITANGSAGGQGVRISGTSQNISGAGGGSGGLILLSSLQSILANTVTTSLSVRGGSGGAALAGADANGGGGGGGGWLVLAAPTVNTTQATILVSGGAAGATLGTPATNLGGGTGGSYAGAGGGSSGIGVFAGSTGIFSVINSIFPIT